jgi:hypothetical protein
MGQTKILEDTSPGELSLEQADAVRSHLEKVLSSEAFMGGQRAKHFLQLVVEHALAGELDSLRERMLGAEMFGRPIDYDTGNDAVVRVKASEVRKRLLQYYQNLPTAPAVQIELPAGSYAPRFHWLPSEIQPTCAEPSNSQPDTISIKMQPAIAESAESTIASQSEFKRWAIRASLLAVYSAALFSIGWFAAGRFTASHRTRRTADPILAALFDGKRNTYIVPADIGFNLLQDMSGHPMGLADYLKGDYLELPTSGVDANTAKGLTQRLTSFVDAQVIATLASLPEYNQQQTFLRFPRDLRFDDLKDANLFLIGSVGSNPWTSIADNSANFRIVYQQGMESATIVNEHPQPGERVTYESRWNEPAHETYALISFLPNLGGKGNLLVLQGLDVAGTQAAAEALFNSDALAPTLQRATRPDGSIRYFEILVRSMSINWNAADSQVIASRIH